MKLKLWINFLSIAIVFAIVKAELLFHNNYSIYIFYSVPISLSAWFCGRRSSLTIAVLCTLAWGYADSIASTYSRELLWWNSGIRLPFFGSMAIILSELRKRFYLEKELAHRDPLTGLMNRRLFTELAEHELTRYKRYSRPFTLCFMDLDNFKNVNDKMGHHKGDEYLKVLSTAVKGTLRENDLVARFGGDEFVILLPETDMESSREVISKLQLELEKNLFLGQWKASFSIGSMTVIDKPVDSVEELIMAADALMYEAKKEGKNRAIHAEYQPPYKS